MDCGPDTLMAWGCGEVEVLTAAVARTLRSNDATRAEGQTGSSPLTFTLTLSHKCAGQYPSPSEPVVAGHAHRSVVGEPLARLGEQAAGIIGNDHPMAGEPVAHTAAEWAKPWSTYAKQLGIEHSLPAVA